MTNLTTTATTQPANDVSVNLATGEAFISIRRLAKELGIHHSSLNKHLSSRHPNLMFSKGIPPEIMQQAAKHYAFKSQAANPRAESFYDMLCGAGAKAWLYHEAGYVVSASPIKQVALPEDYVSALRALADKEEQRILLLTENQEKHIETDSSETHFTIRKVRNVNQGMKFDGKLLVKRSEELEVLVKQVFDLYEQQVNSYHKDIWLDVYPDAILP